METANGAGTGSQPGDKFLTAEMTASRRLRICLAASGGGHLRQLVDLRPFWEHHESFVVTEDTSFAASLSGDLQTHFVPHFRIAQVRTHSLLSVVKAVAGNVSQAWKAIRAGRPQLVISTGAGAVFPAVIFAKLHGARFVLIESFARFEAPSIFGRLARPFADIVVVQSTRLKERWPEAELFDPFVVLGPATGDKENLGLITVGTLLPFDRLVNAVAALPDPLRPETIVAQVGKGGARPPGMEVQESIAFEEMGALLERANIVFCHGGSGSLITALRAGCRVVAMPRRKDLGENHDDHQQEIVSALASRGLIEAAAEAEDVAAATQAALAKQPQRATTDPSALIERLRQLAREWFPSVAVLEDHPAVR